MAVAQHRRLAGKMQPVRIYQRMARGSDNLDVLQTRSRQTGRHELRRALNVGGMIGKSADAGDAKELLQLVEETVLVFLNENTSGWRHFPL